MQRSRHFMNKTVDILRATISLNANNLDYNVASFPAVKTSVPAYIEPAGADVVMDTQLGSVGVYRFTIYFLEDVAVKVNDIIKDGTTYYRVLGVTDYSSFGWHVRCDCAQTNYTRAE